MKIDNQLCDLCAFFVSFVVNLGHSFNIIN